MRAAELRASSTRALRRLRISCQVQLRRAALGNPNSPDERAAAQAVRGQLHAIEHELERRQGQQRRDGHAS